MYIQYKCERSYYVGQFRFKRIFWTIWKGAVNCTFCPFFNVCVYVLFVLCVCFFVRLELASWWSKHTCLERSRCGSVNWSAFFCGGTVLLTALQFPNWGGIGFVGWVPNPSMWERFEKAVCIYTVYKKRGIDLGIHTFMNSWESILMISIYGIFEVGEPSLGNIFSRSVLRQGMSILDPRKMW